MPRFTILIKPSARKELEGLSDQLVSRIVPKIEKLTENPRPAGTRKLRGYTDIWRIRVGDYRIVYIIDGENRTVTITRIAHRRDVYEP